MFWFPRAKILFALNRNRATLLHRIKTNSAYDVISGVVSGHSRTVTGRESMSVCTVNGYSLGRVHCKWLFPSACAL